MQPRASGVAVDAADGVETIPLSIDEKSIDHLMGSFINQYSDPITTAIREYATNGWDAHIEAGNTHLPIEITLPTDLSPTFVVTDRGTGMSLHDMKTVYSKYGASTKRTTDEQAGMWGLGCKSALAYANQFTVTAVKDGMLINMTIGRTKKGGGGMNKMSDPAPTDEPNGVTISIPVARDDVHKFREKAFKFFRFWEPGQVLIDGEPVEQPEDMIVLDEQFSLVQTPSTAHYRKDPSTHYVVMGNVPYPVSREEVNLGARFLHSDWQIVARVPIGSLDFPPAREELTYTPETKAVLQQLRESFQGVLAEHINKELKTCKTHTEALREYSKWSRILLYDGLKRLKLTYRGKEIPDDLKAKGWWYDPAGTTRPRDQGHVAEIDFSLSRGEVLILGLIVTNYDKKNFTSQHSRNKLREYAEEHGLKAPFFLVADDDLGMPWTEDIPKVSWDIIAKRKSTRQSVNKSDYLNEEVAIHVGGTTFFATKMTLRELLDIKATTYKIVVIGPKINTAYAGILSCAHQKDMSSTAVIRLGKNQWERFCRTYPNAILLEEWLREQADEIIKGMSDWRYLQLHAPYLMSGGAFRSSRQVDISKIKDPDLKCYIKLVPKKKGDEGRDDQDRRWSHIQRVYRLHQNGYGHLPPLTTPDPKRAKLVALVDKLAKRYPYLSDKIWTNHAYTYVNSLYETEYKKEATR